MKTKLAVIFGGMSTEHDVSIVSGFSILKNLNKLKYEIIPIYISQDGNWYEYKTNINEITMPKVGDRINNLERIENPIKTLKQVDVAFPVLHGLYGEDGTIQGMLEMLKIPYVGCKVLASAICMDKAYTKIILKKAGINQAEYMYIKNNVTSQNYTYVDEELNEQQIEMSELAEKVIQKLGEPVFIKPSNSGSSVGITKANTKRDIIEAIKNAAKYDRKILIEKAINAREIECAVLGIENKVEASCVGEVMSAEDFYSYDAKYKNSQSRTIIPANVDETIANEIKETAIKAFKAVDASGLARIDFFVEKETNKIILNEINTMPGFTAISMYPQLWEKCGKRYSDLLDDLIEYARK